MIERAKPVAFRNIEPIEISQKSPKVHKDSVGESLRTKVKSQNPETKLIIESAVEEKILVQEESEVYKKFEIRNPKSETKLAALDKIRNQVRGNGSHGNGLSAKPIQIEQLQQAWDEYAAKLKEEKNPAGQNFEMAELRVQDDNSFIALVHNNIQLKFIEQQGLKVSQFLREKLQNTQIQFYIVTQENTDANSSIAPLTSREQFQKMAEQYPLIKEFKDRLRLELDY